MRKARMFLIAAGAAMSMQAGTAFGAPPRDPSSGADVTDAIARHDLHASGVAFNALVEARLPSKQTNRPDPLLDRLLVEQMVAQGTQPPRPILQRLANDPTAPDRVHNLLLLATSEESSGAEDDARHHYETVVGATAATADQRLSGQLGLARLKLGADPAAAITILRAVSPAAIPPARRWEVDLQLARAVAIQEPADASAHEAQLAKAWTESPDAGVADHAVARVAGDRFNSLPERRHSTCKHAAN